MLSCPTILLFKLEALEETLFGGLLALQLCAGTGYLSVKTISRLRWHAMSDCGMVSPQALCAILRAAWEQSVC